MQARLRLNFYLPFLVGLSAITTFQSSPVRAADKFDLSAGFFDLSSSSSGTKTAVAAGSSSALGVYQLEYRHGFFSNFELGLGYTLLASGTIGGDLGYGIDFSGYYYPFTLSGPQRWNNKDKYEVVSAELWRPFVGASFNQRTFSTSAAGFAGFGIILGTEKTITEKMSLKSEFRYISLGGSTLTVNSKELLFGVSFTF
jgi:opacity protein-like surface antigen